MLGHSVHPLDGVIETLSRGRHLLTLEHIEVLKQLLPKDRKASEVNEKSTINDLLGTLTTMAGNLKNAAAGAKDPEEFKSVIGSIEKIMSMVNKYTEQVSHEEKLRALQDTITEALNEMSEGSQTKFLETWHAKIEALGK